MPDYLRLTNFFFYLFEISIISKFVGNPFLDEFFFFFCLPINKDKTFVFEISSPAQFRKLGEEHLSPFLLSKEGIRHEIRWHALRFVSLHENLFALNALSIHLVLEILTKYNNGRRIEERVKKLRKNLKTEIDIFV